MEPMEFMASQTRPGPDSFGYVNSPMKNLPILSTTDPGSALKMANGFDLI